MKLSYRKIVAGYNPKFVFEVDVPKTKEHEAFKAGDTLPKIKTFNVECANKQELQRNVRNARRQLRKEGFIVEGDADWTKEIASLIESRLMDPDLKQRMKRLHAELHEALKPIDHHLVCGYKKGCQSILVANETATIAKVTKIALGTLGYTTSDVPSIGFEKKKVLP